MHNRPQRLCTSVSSPVGDSRPVGDSGRHCLQAQFSALLLFISQRCTELSVLTASTTHFHLYFHQGLKQGILMTHILMTLSYRILQLWVHPECLGQSGAAESPFLRRAWPSGCDRALRTECESTATSAPGAQPTAGPPDASMGRALWLRLSLLSLLTTCPLVWAMPVRGRVCPELPCASSSSEVPRLLLGAAGGKSLLPQTSGGEGRSLSRDAGLGLSPVTSSCFAQRPHVPPALSNPPRDTGQHCGDS